MISIDASKYKIILCIQSVFIIKMDDILQLIWIKVFSCFQVCVRINCQDTNATTMISNKNIALKYWYATKQNFVYKYQPMLIRLLLLEILIWFTLSTNAYLIFNPVSILLIEYHGSNFSNSFQANIDIIVETVICNYHIFRIIWFEYLVSMPSLIMSFIYSICRNKHNH